MDSVGLIKMNRLNFFLTGVTSVFDAPIEGALPIPIWRILTPGMILYI